MPTGRGTDKTILVEREARPVGLARTENFVGQFPRNYEGLQLPLPSSVPGFHRSPPAPKWVPASSVGPKLAVLAWVQGAFFSLCVVVGQISPADESRGSNKGKMKFPLSYLPWLTNPNLPSQDEEEFRGSDVESIKG